MAKNFPYFKFVATEWLTGDIVFEDYELQGIFINVCALYWQRNGEVTIDDLQKRMKTDRLTELTDRFFSVSDGFISVKFLDEQLIDAGHISKVNSENGSKGGRPKKSETPENIEEKTDRLATDNRTESEIKQRKEEEKKRKEESKIDFNTFWDLYGNKTNRKKSKAKWDKLNLETQELIIKTLPDFLAYKPFQNYTHPNPETYLNNERWNDVIPSSPQNVKVAEAKRTTLQEAEALKNSFG